MRPFRIFSLCDDYHGTMFYVLSENLADWEDMQELPDVSDQVRHGTIIYQGD